MAAGLSLCVRRVEAGVWDPRAWAAPQAPSRAGASREALHHRAGLAVGRTVLGPRASYGFLRASHTLLGARGERKSLALSPSRSPSLEQLGSPALAVWPSHVTLIPSATRHRGRSLHPG